MDTGRLPKSVKELQYEHTYVYVPITQKFKDIEYKSS